jgi:lysophospholipase L1-like esterase
MKSIRTLAFILTIILVLGAGWFFFPAEGITIGNQNLRFPSYAEDSKPAEKEVDVDDVLNKVTKSFEMTCSDNVLDSMRFFRSYLKENPNRIYLPNDDYTYFDPLFHQLEQAQSQGKTYRVMHYGDSQIEMDRISSVLRQKLQELFGGSGPNMIPAVQPVATISVSQQASGLNRYAVYGDASNQRANHNRYGVMAQFSQVVGGGSMTFIRSNHSQALDNVKEISTVSVLLGRNSQNFTATLKCGDIATEPKVLPANDSVSLITWILPEDIQRGTISFKGNAEIYGILLDGDPGVAIDNVALRGCSGTIFTRINESIARQSFKLLDTKLIILQFGGNRMPGITTSKSITPYMAELENQINYIKRVAPKATLLFIGPADMGRSYGGKMGTWHGLPELNDSLRAMALRNKVAYWDMFHVMGGEGSMAQWVKHKPALAGPDYIHFTFNGAQEIGADLARSFTTYYDFYKLRQHVPSEKVIEFVNLDRKEDSIRTAGRIKLPTYNPYGIKNR